MFCDVSFRIEGNTGKVKPHICGFTFFALWLLIIDFYEYGWISKKMTMCVKMTFLYLEYILINSVVQTLQMSVKKPWHNLNK